MILFLIAMLGCDPPDPLPPSAAPEKPRNSRMVASGDVRGFLVDARIGKEGTLLLVDRIDKATRNRSKTIANGPVFVVPGSVDMGQARAYFEGLKSVDTVRMICERKTCPEGLNPPK
jgi:uncharacterized secreted protein with C-terminal beta-propeller domain